jgi:hypothetical protein
MIRSQFDYLRVADRFLGFRLGGTITSSARLNARSSVSIPFAVSTNRSDCAGSSGGGFLAAMFLTFRDWSAAIGIHHQLDCMSAILLVNPARYGSPRQSSRSFCCWLPQESIAIVLVNLYTCRTRS